MRPHDDYAQHVRVEEAERVLRERLEAAGLDLTRLAPRETWRIFKEFANETVEGFDGDDDMLMFEYGVYDWGDGKGNRVNWVLCRQFAFYDKTGEYEHMEQLRCVLYFTPRPELEEPGVESSIWPREQASGWIADVEQLSGHAVVLDATPVESEVAQDEV